MVSNMTLLAMIPALFISLILPIIAILVLARKNRGEKMISAWLLGAAGFFVTQILIRVPILTAIQYQPWFIDFSENHVFLFAFTLAFTAGLFELAGRFAVAKLMRKNLNYKRSLAAGLGHGGIEAMLLVGSTYMAEIALIFLINGGGFDAVVAEAAQAGVDASALIQLKDTLIHTHPALFLLGGYERLMAMIGHLGMSMMVCHGVHIGKPLKSALIALGIHTFIDLTAGISMLIGKGLSQGAAYGIIYTILTAMAVISILIICNIRRNWQETEASHV